jgi:hypothetical protein
LSAPAAFTVSPEIRQRTASSKTTENRPLGREIDEMRLSDLPTPSGDRGFTHVGLCYRTEKSNTIFAFIFASASRSAGWVRTPLQRSIAGSQ